MRFWKLSFHTFTIPEYPNPWKLSTYNSDEFLNWWTKERSDVNAEHGWMDIRFFARKVFYLERSVRTEALRHSVFLKHVEVMAEKAKQIARVIALLYGSCDEYDEQIQEIFECSPPVIYLLQQVFKGCIDAVRTQDENQEIANGLSDLDLMSVDPLLTELARRLLLLQLNIPLNIGRDYLKPDLLEGVYKPPVRRNYISPGETLPIFHLSQEAQKIMEEERLADDPKELVAVARGLQMIGKTLHMLSPPSVGSPLNMNISNEDILDVTRKYTLFDMLSTYAAKNLKQGHGVKKRFLDEVKVWVQLDDDFILRLKGFCVLDFSPLPGLVTELCRGSLKDIVDSSNCITKEGSLSVVERLEFLRDVSYGLRYLHSKSIAHGDLRAANILITFPTEDNNGRPKAILCDFGISRSEIEVIEDIAARVIAGKRLSEAWRSPEIVTYYREKNQVRVSSEGDMYSYGCVFLEVVYDREPFKDVNNPGNELLKGKLPATCEDIPDLKTTHWSFMKSLWDPEPGKRPNANTVSLDINELIISSGDSS
ncbi:hypothetical protein M0805_002644 [Coniferiporia weirii]|nr:hypothetical protein M0805_002644 [Coniferiporia weirii]